MNLFFRLKREEKGAAALEFALVAPALILFIVGIAQFGVLFMANNGLSNAVGEGVQGIGSRRDIGDGEATGAVAGVDPELIPAAFRLVAKGRGD